MSVDIEALKRQVEVAKATTMTSAVPGAPPLPSMVLLNVHTADAILAALERIPKLEETLSQKQAALEASIRERQRQEEEGEQPCVECGGHHFGLRHGQWLWTLEHVEAELESALAAAREENRPLREGLEAIALGVAGGNRGHDLVWAEIAEAALAGREPEDTMAMSWLVAARRAARERAALAREDGGDG